MKLLIIAKLGTMSPGHLLRSPPICKAVHFFHFCLRGPRPVRGIMEGRDPLLDNLKQLKLIFKEIVKTGNTVLYYLNTTAASSPCFKFSWYSYLFHSKLATPIHPYGMVEVELNDDLELQLWWLGTRKKWLFPIRFLSNVNGFTGAETRIKLSNRN